jgi:hypothetical protein
MMAKSRAQQAAIAISMKKAGKTPKGYHKMPDGTVMKNSAHNKLSASKKSLAKAQVGKQMSDSVFNQKYKPDPGFFKSPPKDWKPKDIDPGFNKEPKGSYTPKKPKLSKDGYIQYKKGGSTPAWTRKEGKNPAGGLNAKGVASYRAANPGSKLQTAVTTKPSKLKPGSKDAKRRKSFCARMSGVKGPMKDEKGRPTRKALSLRKWNC